MTAVEEAVEERVDDESRSRVALSDRLRSGLAVARQPRTLIVLLIAVLVGYLALVPLLYMVWGTFSDEGGFTLKFLKAALTDEGFLPMVWNSLLFAIGSTAIAMALGTGLAFLAVRTDMPFKGLVGLSALVPLFLPGVLYTSSWVFLASPKTGLLNEWFLGPIGMRFDIFSLEGMILVQALHSIPIAYLLMASAFQSMDPSLEESAMMSGARLTTAIRRVTVPLVRPATYAVMLILGVNSLESFEVPALLGINGDAWVFTSRIWRALNSFPPDFGSAGANAILLLVLASVGVYLYNRMTKKTKEFQTITGKGFRPRVMEMGKFRWLAAIFVLLYVLVAVALPIFILVYTSTQGYYATPTLERLQNMSLDNYAAIFNDGSVQRSLRNSAILGVASATAVMFVMAIVSWIVVRTQIPGRWLIDNLAFLPMVVPGLVLGVALLFVYLRSPLPVYGTLWILFIAYFTKYMPYGMRYASSAMFQISGELEEVAETSGASWWRTFRRITLPLLVPGLVAGWSYILMVSIRELSSSILLYSPGNQVLSIEIWNRWNAGRFGDLAALGVIMIVVLGVLLAITQKLGSRVGIQGR